MKELAKKLGGIIDRLSECQNEAQAQDIICFALRHFNCRKRVRLVKNPDLPDLEIDILCDSFAIEVKFDAKYYDGFAQVISYRCLYGFENMFLLHIKRNFDYKFLNAIKRLSKKLNVPTLIMFLDRKEILVMQ